MPYDPHKHHRRSIRLKGYDYTTSGIYFVTICVQNRHCVLGEVINGEMVLSPIGQIVADAWCWLAEQYDYVMLGAWTVMPNHLHGLLMLVDLPALDSGTGTSRRGASRRAPTTDVSVKVKSLGQLVGAFKTVSTKAINKLQETPGTRFWQRNYYERIVRNEREQRAIEQYIYNNPATWPEDKLHPDAPPNRFNQG
ncbi:MAG: transposase [Anaerolineaceae bacterium]|nr:transposase [Anaerolineaceae bacterium]